MVITKSMLACELGGFCVDFSDRLLSHEDDSL